ncbi:hypothetical protein DLREEDagr8_06610 [Dongia sp. agr-C8]
MESRDLPAVVKATFGVGSDLGVNFLTATALLHKEHNIYCPTSNAISAPAGAHPILRFASHNYYSKSRIPDPDPCLTGGLGQQ